MKKLTIKKLILGILIVWIVFNAILFIVFQNLSDSGPFGDTFGAINSLFSGLAFAGVIYTIILQNRELELQREELGLQRQELTLTRKELARTASAQEQSEAALREQSETLKKTAKLNALNSILEYHLQILSQFEMGSALYEQEIRKVETTKNKINELIEE